MIILRKSTVAAFTLLELLVVIAILGLLAAITVPALKNIGKGQAVKSASRQLLDDLGRARQLAISQRTTVYMVFVPPNFWSTMPLHDNTTSFNNLAPEERIKALRVLDKQLTGYALVSRRSVGEQPGRSTARYLSSWRSLPEGTFIDPMKFTRATNASFTIFDAVGSRQFDVVGFDWANTLPFPSQESLVTGLWLPFLAFNHLGQLLNSNGKDAFIPLAQGSVGFSRDLNKMPKFGPLSVREVPPGNVTNSFNIIRVDGLTGRARLERQEVQ